MLLYTDGTYEVKNPHREEFGTQRLEETIVQETGESGLALVNRLLGSIERFKNGNPTDDDLTFVAVDVAESEGLAVPTQ
jgi:serine phosphatase RsbU (regulator of sigma subunit)